MVFLHSNVGVFCQIRFILIYRYQGLIVTLVFRSSSLASLLEQAAGFGIFSKNQTSSQSSWFGSWVLLVVSYFWPPWISTCSRGFVCTIHVNVLVYCPCYCNIGGQFSKFIQYGDYEPTLPTVLAIFDLFWLLHFIDSFITPRQYCSVVLSYSETSGIIMCIICNTTWPQIWCQVSMSSLCFTLAKAAPHDCFHLLKTIERLMAHLHTAVFHYKMKWHNLGLSQMKLRKLLITF